jgi:DNA-binding GntR family transcriptional regulator
MPTEVCGEGYIAYRQFSSQDAAFHEAVAQGSGNALLAESINRLHSHVHLYRLYFEAGLTQDSLAEHQSILDAITSGDPDDAEHAMRKHLTRSRTRLLPAVAATSEIPAASGNTAID